jgi:hypothetical protein
MPRTILNVTLASLVAVVAVGSHARPNPQPVRRTAELQVSSLHAVVSAMQGCPRAVVFDGLLPGYRRGPPGEIRNVACVFSAKPGAALPKEYDAAQVRFAVGNIQPGGEFQVSVPLYLIRRRPRDWGSLNVRFVGPVSFHDTPATIFQAPVLGVDSVKLGDLPELSDAMQVINSGPSVLDANYDPLLTLRACNSLLRMGKERALLVLRSYTDIAALPYIWEELPGRPESLDASDQRRVIELLHLACEPRAPTKDLLSTARNETRSIDLSERERLRFRPSQGWHPLWYLGMVRADSSDPAQYPGSDYPFVIVGDVPFYLPELLSGRTGYDSSPGPFLTLFERYGEFRQRGVYRPSGTLAEILEGVIQRIPARKQELCDQTLALLPLDLGDVPAGVRRCAEQWRVRDCEPIHLAAVDCDALLEWLRRTPLVWDEKAESFVKR